LFHVGYYEYLFISNGFLKKTDLRYQELQDKIWENANDWISMTDLWRHIHGDKKTCFDTIKLMIPMQLKEKRIGNRIYVKRIDTSKRAEFENGLTFQENGLSLMRDELKKYPKPIFYKHSEIIHYQPPLTLGNLTKAENQKRVKEFNTNPKFRKKFKVVEKIPIWKTRKSNVKKTLENMRFYYSGLFIYISRNMLQKSLSIISTKEANIRIKKCEIALEKHFNIMLKENPKDREAIRQFHEFGYWFQTPISDLGKFRI